MGAIQLSPSQAPAILFAMLQMVSLVMAVDDPSCTYTEQANLTDCKSCVEISALGGRPNVRPSVYYSFKIDHTH